MSTVPSLVGKIISGCEILEKTAEGGMGAVYRAKHRALNRIVCVKILSPALSNDKKAVELFLTEARAIAELDHPNIVNVYNVGKEHGFYFIVMSFIEGQTLSSLLKKNKVLPVKKVLDLFDGVLQGLEAAHAKGIIHRDIKPSNILINLQGQAKLVDFGIAKKVEKDGATKTNELAGTAYFIAPEQALGQNLDTRADLYALGASLYYVLTGQFPYNGKNTIEIIQKHINNPVPNPAELRKDLPAWLGPAIQKLMSKNPDERFQTAKETYLYFRKMRAEDQLRLESGSGGKAVDLGGEEAMMVVKEERHPTQTLRTQRDLYTKTPTQHTVNNLIMPQINENISPEKYQTELTRRKLAAQVPSVQMLKTDAAKPDTTFTKKQSRGPRFLTAAQRKILSFCLLVPLFAVFAGAVAYAFYMFGHICSVHVSADAGLWSNLIGPLFASQYAPNQLMLTAVCVVMLALIFASSAIKAFSHSTTLLLFLAGVSYVAGLFTPEIPFMEMNKMTQFLFSPEYYLCYLVVALAWGLSLCWTINRSLAQGILGAALVIFCMSLAYATANLSIAPNHQDVFFMALFYLSLFCGICAIYYLISRTYKDAILLPFFLFLAAVFGMWTYTVSGLESSVETTVNALISNIEVASYGQRPTSQTLQDQLDLTVPNSSMRTIDKSNEFSDITLEAVAQQLAPRIEKTTPNTFNDQTRMLFARLMAPYYQGGKQPMKFAIWGFALTYPIHHFNKNAQTNDAYFFLMAMLYCCCLLGCASTIVIGDNL